MRDKSKKYLKNAQKWAEGSSEEVTNLVRFGGIFCYCLNSFSSLNKSSVLHTIFLFFIEMFKSKCIIKI